jgi:hypothetical protein
MRAGKAWALSFLLFASAIPAFAAGSAGPKSWLRHLRGSGHPRQTNNHVVTKHHPAAHPKRHQPKAPHR